MTKLERFEPLIRTSPLTDLIGPLYGKGKRQELEIGTRVEEKHCNVRGTVHGGVLETLTDLALEYTMVRACAASADDKEARA